jgi:diadenosine tetraphosphate (Ap4A) HIT family hydrolase
MSEGFQPPENLIITQTDDWVLNHRADAALPGYLMLGAKAPTHRLAAMSQRALSQLGQLMAAAQDALEAVLAPKQLYIGRYGHGAGHSLHFHIVPVCDWVIRGFFADPRYQPLESLQTPGYGGTDGADWADGADLTLYIWREFCESPRPPAIAGPSIGEVVKRLKAHFSRGAEAKPVLA